MCGVGRLNILILHLSSLSLEWLQKCLEIKVSKKSYHESMITKLQTLGTMINNMVK